jgi:hypothetical protein
MLVVKKVKVVGEEVQVTEEMAVVVVSPLWW